MNDAPIYGSYVEAWAASKASASATQGLPRGTVPMRRPARHVPTCPAEWAEEALPKKPISVLHRPKNIKSSRKNEENLEIQYSLDRDAFERQACGYRRLAQEKWHHNKVGGILTLWEEGHIVDKGRGKSIVESSRGVYDPINHHHTILPTPPAAQPARPSSAPHQRPSTAGSEPADRSSQPPWNTRHRVPAQNQGRYNPLTHTYAAAPLDPSYAARRDKEFERANASNVGHRPSAAPASASGNVAGAVVAAAAAGDGPAVSAPDSSSRHPPKTAAAPGRTKVMSGTSWGTYNPILHVWAQPPKDAGFVTQNEVTDRQAGIGGCALRKVQRPANQGVYNCILNTWTERPENPRMVAGLSFAPATLFCRPGPTTVRA
ncbi:MAG: hypothetical protein WDW36_005762 [Sanguina aurantia]